jgi:hypothetical protein
MTETEGDTSAGRGFYADLKTPVAVPHPDAQERTREESLEDD